MWWCSENIRKAKLENERKKVALTKMYFLGEHK
jgi:hypothetical protein